MDRIFWFLIESGHVFLIVLLFHKTKMYKIFPWFTFLISQELLQVVILSSLYDPKGSQAYTVAYGLCEICDLALQMLSVYEFSVATNKRLKIMSYSLAFYMCIEMVLQLYLKVFGTHHWNSSVKFIQPVYLICEVVWYFVLLNTYHRAKESITRSNTNG